MVTGQVTSSWFLGLCSLGTEAGSSEFSTCSPVANYQASQERRPHNENQPSQHRPHSMPLASPSSLTGHCIYFRSLQFVFMVESRMKSLHEPVLEKHIANIQHNKAFKKPHRCRRQHGGYQREKRGAGRRRGKGGRNGDGSRPDLGW